MRVAPGAWAQHALTRHGFQEFFAGPAALRGHLGKQQAGVSAQFEEEAVLPGGIRRRAEMRRNGVSARFRFDGPSTRAAGRKRGSSSAAAKVRSRDFLREWARGPRLPHAAEQLLPDAGSRTRRGARKAAEPSAAGKGGARGFGATVQGLFGAFEQRVAVGGVQVESGAGK